MDLVKMFQGPGLATKDEIEEAIVWLTQFKKDLDTYRVALGEPLGYSVESRLEVLRKTLSMKLEK